MKNTTSIKTRKYSELYYRPFIKRNMVDMFYTIISSLFTFLVILPLLLILSYILIKGISVINFSALTQLPEPPGDDLGNAGGFGNAIIGTLFVTSMASAISVPIGVGGGIYLAEYSSGGSFAKFIRFGCNVLAGIPSIICGVFIYGVIVSTRLIMDSTYSAIAGAIALSILMLPTIIKTTDEALKLVSDELRKAAIGLGASSFITITRITLPAAIRPISTGILLAIARAAGETAPLIFTALFSFYWSSGSELILDPIASLSVLIYNFAMEPYQLQNELAWSASFILVISLLLLNIFSRMLSKPPQRF